MLKCEDINLNYLFELGEDDPDFAIEIIETFISDVPSTLDIIKELYHQKKYTEIAPIAHKIKSSVMIFGLKDFLSLLKEVELIPLNNKTSAEAEALISEMILNLEKMISCLNQELIKLQS